jgi:hypothetical protein
MHPTFTRIHHGPNGMNTDLVLEYYLCPHDQDWKEFCAELQEQFPGVEQELIYKEGFFGVLYRIVKPKQPSKKKRSDF